MRIFTDNNAETFYSLVKECGSLILSATSIEADTKNIKNKSGDADFVTVFDEEVQKRLICGLSSMFPEAKFFAEEKENSSDDVNDGLCFIIDPIDGTTNFIHDLRASTISIAATYNGVPVFGCVYDPYRNDIFTAQKGCGAYMNNEKISVSSRTLEKSVVAFGTTPYKKKQYSDIGFEIAKQIFQKSADVRRSGSAALDMAYVACGKLDGFFECILSPWDYAAGYVLVTEAGGIFTDFNGDKVQFSEAAPVLCSNGIIHKELVSITNK